MAQRVLILGGAGGIGSAVARSVVVGGGQVFLAGRDAARLEALGGELGMPSGPVDATAVIWDFFQRHRK